VQTSFGQQAHDLQYTIEHRRGHRYFRKSLTLNGSP
jgi:hypothetical protein